MIHAWRSVHQSVSHRCSQATPDPPEAFSEQETLGNEVAEIGASKGMYDYLRKVVVLGQRPYQFHLKNVNSQDWGTPVDIEDVPPRLLIPFDQRPSPGVPWVEMSLGMLKNMPQSDPKDAPDLDPFIDNEEIVDAPCETPPHPTSPSPASAP